MSNHNIYREYSMFLREYLIYFTSTAEYLVFLTSALAFYNFVLFFHFQQVLDSASLTACLDIVL